ncbi:sigma-70 family RNA polymerase sigma factor [Ravibacter arvi]|uniref:Sigma-70 family RNA polymerase sigma factor n=1 Tax=Ravibacter arvi TaxID=2051041 RepID=A0ABP8MAC6_9BACT
MKDSTWQQVQAGDNEAFQRLHNEHVRHLLNYGLRLCGSISTVEDCVQDVFTELWIYRSSITQPTSMRFYLLKAVRNKLKAQYRREQLFVSGWDDNSDTLVQPDFNVESSSEQKLIQLEIDLQRRDQIKAAMNLLSPRQREIIYLRYFNELTYDQICALMGITYQTARSQVYSGLKILRSELKDSPLLMLLSFLFFF